jgi:hypothetical protein
MGKGCRFFRTVVLNGVVLSVKFEVPSADLIVIPRGARNLLFDGSVDGVGQQHVPRRLIAVSE